MNRNETPPPDRYLQQRIAACRPLLLTKTCRRLYNLNQICCAFRPKTGPVGLPGAEKRGGRNLFCGKKGPVSRRGNDEAFCPLAKEHLDAAARCCGTAAPAIPVLPVPKRKSIPLRRTGKGSPCGKAGMNNRSAFMPNILKKAPWAERGYEDTAISPFWSAAPGRGLRRGRKELREEICI